MNSLRTKFSIFLVFMFAVPTGIAYFCYVDVTHVMANVTLTSELKAAEESFRRNTTWSDQDLAQAQKVRAGLTHSDLQEAFSHWIQARSEDNAHLVTLRSAEFEKLLAAKMARIKSENQSQMNELTNMFALLSAYLLGLAGVAFYFCRVRVFNRVAALTKEIGQFRVTDYKTKLQTSVIDDEVGNLWTSFYAMIDSLYFDLHDELKGNDNIAAGGADVVLKNPDAMKEEVQALMLERRTYRNDRRTKERSTEEGRRRRA